jgi:hypothetical protein
MTTQKPTIGNAAVSRGLSNADDKALRDTSSRSTKKRTSRRNASGFGLGEAVENPGTVMARGIDRHRRLLAAIDRFSSKGPSNCRTLRAAAAWLGLAVSRLLERSARRRLIQLKAVDGREAEQKVLYLIAAILARKMDLQPAEIADIATSVEEFRPMVADLLRRHDI